MSEKKTKSYTAEFKESAVKLAVESDQPVSATAKDLGVNVNTLHTWIRAISFGTNILCPVTLKQLKRYGILHPKTKDAIYDPLGCIFRTD